MAIHFVGLPASGPFVIVAICAAALLVRDTDVDNKLAAFPKTTVPESDKFPVDKNCACPEDDADVLGLIVTDPAD